MCTGEASINHSLNVNWHLFTFNSFFFLFYIIGAYKCVNAKKKISQGTWRTANHLLWSTCPENYVMSRLPVSSYMLKFSSLMWSTSETQQVLAPTCRELEWTWFQSFQPKSNMEVLNHKAKLMNNHRIGSNSTLSGLSYQSSRGNYLWHLETVLTLSNDILDVFSIQLTNNLCKLSLEC